MANKSYLNVMSPYGAWDSDTTYIAQTLYLGVANSPNVMNCPVVSNSSHVYYATGFTVGGTPLQPTKGVAPGSDTAWQLLI